MWMYQKDSPLERVYVYDVILAHPSLVKGWLDEMELSWHFTIGEGPCGFLYEKSMGKGKYSLRTGGIKLCR